MERLRRFFRPRSRRIGGLALLCLCLAALFFALRNGRGDRLDILMYHDVVPDGAEAGNWSVTVSQLREDLQWLTDRGYVFYLPRELSGTRRLAPRAVMLTFDDGYRSNYELAFPLLREYGAKAVIAPIVGRITEGEDPVWLSWDMCREMADSGLVELGSHTYDLHADSEAGLGRLPEETPEAYAARVFPDLLRSIETLEDRTGQPVRYLAYPNGVTEPLAEAFVAEHFEMSVTTRWGAARLSRGRYDLPRRNINDSTRASLLGRWKEWFR